MKRIAVIFHSGHGNTEHFARHVVAGAQSVPDTEVSLIKAETITSNPDQLLDFDGFVWGSPTYLGGVSGPFKSFMDATGGLWRTQQLKGKLAAGFTVSAMPLNTASPSTARVIRCPHLMPVTGSSRSSQALPACSEKGNVNVQATPTSTIDRR